ncbi:probable LRR receptor-like serine/threonine-protein kinase At1g74360 [Amborella trichopoda]|uniref:non-specific serine/threonine protein kinase n=1 Tax=Amborella trichopoda TaxID=13333 RepID=U5D357_AMBTC|nr:probable LRR receptor-like serine/threonine-protein kinase At1g74360 [Amborella trichopoda]ERN16864.1 hypothetical protein AMTR_s00057p00145210 [Amborella trichopoda]|eukprot:XP_006855397.1 probable LRR receptor-like serine/threonine-protein kinase At1g74360 [Amborella trichopoda]
MAIMRERSSRFSRLSWRLFMFITLILFVTIASASTPEQDREVLLNFKSFLLRKNPVNRGRYDHWNESIYHCQWPGINCTGDRVTGISLSDCNIQGPLYANFSSLTELEYLDFSRNTLSGPIPFDFSLCNNLRLLNLSYNILDGTLNLTGLPSLETLDLTVNRLNGGIQLSFPAICNNLINVNLSTNRFSGNILGSFDDCQKLQSLDLSSNNFSGDIWQGFTRLKEFSVSENFLSGEISAGIFAGNCGLHLLDLSENAFQGTVPPEISNCQALEWLNVWGNNFTGNIPSQIGSLRNLVSLFLGNNSFSREIPASLENCTSLRFLDLSRNNFGGVIQPVISKFVQIKLLVLHGNGYKDGLLSSGILNMPNISRLDLSLNEFSGNLPAEIAQMSSLKFLILAYNKFSGNIPPEFGNLSKLQALDLSYNKLTGSIPATFGKLSSLLWLMLAGNSLSGEIPPEIGNCNSLLWVNLADNKLSGKIPDEIAQMGINPNLTFEYNRANMKVAVGSGECLAMKRWIPANYPPFSFVYTLLTRKSCRGIWDRVLKGYGLFPICLNNSGSSPRTLTVSGYLQLTGNNFSGEIPTTIGNMKKLSLLHLGSNNFSGHLPPELAQIPLVVLNVSRNGFTGDIPARLGSMACLQNLDLSVNNFSGDFPASFRGLTDLSKFNLSYNPFLTGTVRASGQLGTFEADSFLGVPLLCVESLKNSAACTNNWTTDSKQAGKKGSRGIAGRPVTLAIILASLSVSIVFLLLWLATLTVFFFPKNPSKPDEEDSTVFALMSSKRRHDQVSSSTFSSTSPDSSDSVYVFRVDSKPFTYSDILEATENFSDRRIIGRGGYATVYRGMLPDGRHVAVKRLRQQGAEAEREFEAEMETLSRGARHPNLVILYGWCMFGEEKALVYEYMEGGSLEEWLEGKKGVFMGWRMRFEVVYGVAKGLAYLHHECMPAIVHRDVKASNIMLEGDGGGARVGDFGLARVVGVGSTHVSTVVAGTVGYVAPEYGQTWKATTKGDVYSFGVLVLEVLTGRRAVGNEETLVEWVRRVVEEKGWRGAVHEGLCMEEGKGINLYGRQVEGLVEVGLRCTEEKPCKRPDMKEVVAMLLGCRGGGVGVDSSAAPAC